MIDEVAFLAMQDHNNTRSVTTVYYNGVIGLAASPNRWSNF